jgi:hypothetical protein
MPGQRLRLCRRAGGEASPRALRGRAQADQGGQVFGARAPAALLMPAADERGETHAPLHVQGGRTRRAVKLVTRQTQQIDAECGHVDRKLAHRLIASQWSCTRAVHGSATSRTG